MSAGLLGHKEEALSLGTGPLSRRLLELVKRCARTSTVYADMATDGRLGGPNLTQMASICDGKALYDGRTTLKEMNVAAL